MRNKMSDGAYNFFKLALNILLLLLFVKVIFPRTYTKPLTYAAWICFFVTSCYSYVLFIIRPKTNDIRKIIRKDDEKLAMRDFPFNWYRNEDIFVFILLIVFIILFGFQLWGNHEVSTACQYMLDMLLFIISVLSTAYYSFLFVGADTYTLPEWYIIQKNDEKEEKTNKESKEKRTEEKKDDHEKEVNE